VRWLEEPINPMDDYDGLRFVRERCNLLVAAGENEYTHYGFKTLIEKQAADLLQPDIIKSGGLLCCRKILAMAEASNLQVIPHSFYYGPGVAATAHFVMANPLSDEMETIPRPLRTTSWSRPCAPSPATGRERQAGDSASNSTRTSSRTIAWTVRPRLAAGDVTSRPVPGRKRRGRTTTLQAGRYPLYSGPAVDRRISRNRREDAARAASGALRGSSPHAASETRGKHHSAQPRDSSSRSSAGSTTPS
jgi:hypothetical protein